MNKFLAFLLIVIALPALGQTSPENNGTFKRWFGTNTTGALLFTATGTGEFDACQLMTTSGVATVEVSLDGINFTAAGISLEDFGATDNNPVLVTVVNRLYGFVGKFKAIRVRASGGSATGSMNCWSLGQSRAPAGNV